MISGFAAFEKNTHIGFSLDGQIVYEAMRMQGWLQSPWSLFGRPGAQGGASDYSPALTRTAGWMVF